MWTNQLDACQYQDQLQVSTLLLNHTINFSRRKKNESNFIGTGRRLGLHLVLNADVPDYFCSSTNSFGFKILLHNPVEMPQISYYGIIKK